MKKIKSTIYNLITNKYFIYLFSYAVFLIGIWNADILANSYDAAETVKVVEGMLSGELVGSYVMYKGLYAFITGVISIGFSKIVSVSPYLLYKIMKSLAFAYITTVGVPFLIGKLFKKKVEWWQKYIFTIAIFIFEREACTLLSVDLMSFFFLLLLINGTIKLTEEGKILNAFLIGMLGGIGVCLSGQYSISTYIILVYLIVILIKKYKKVLKKFAKLLIAILVGFTLTKAANILYETKVVDRAREAGAWIPTGNDWLLHGLSSNLLSINYPALLPDNLSLSLVHDDDEEKYTNLKNGMDVYSVKDYVKLIIKYPLAFIVRWTERLFLGLINDPLNHFAYSIRPGTIVISFMATVLYVFWYYIRKNLKRFKDLCSFQFIVFLSILFSALIPTFAHVENRYYFAVRTILIGILILSPLLSSFVKNLKNKKIHWNRINMDVLTCIIFIVICHVTYYALYQSLGISSVLFN